MTNLQPAPASPTVIRVPADRLQRARSAQTTLLLLGIVVGGAFLAMALWSLSSRSPDVVLSLVFGLIGLGILAAPVATVARWRRNLRQAVGDDGVVLAVDPVRVVLGAFGQVAWSDLSEIVFTDQRTSEPGTGSAAGVGRAWGKVLRDRGGKSELDLLVTFRDGARPTSVPPVAAASGMTGTSNGRAVVRLPFGAALPVDAFHDAYRALEPVAIAHGIALRYDNKASI